LREQTVAVWGLLRQKRITHGSQTTLLPWGKPGTRATGGGGPRTPLPPSDLGTVRPVSVGGRHLEGLHGLGTEVVAPELQGRRRVPSVTSRPKPTDLHGVCGATP